nr:hypothetical protein GCM10025699_42250 [Microbacterium flavescens]
MSFRGAVSRSVVRTGTDTQVVLDHRPDLGRRVGEDVLVAFVPRAVPVAPIG